MSRRRSPRHNPDSILDRIDPASVALGVGVAAVVWFVFLRPKADPQSAPPAGTSLPGQQPSAPIGGGVRDASPQLGDGSTGSSDLTPLQRAQAMLTAAEQRAGDTSLSEADRAAARDLAVKLRDEIASASSST